MTRGFTFIELLVVTGLLVLLGAFITPTYQLIMAQLQLSASVDQVAEHIRLAQQKTVTEQQIYGVTFVTGSSSVPLYLFNPVTNGKTTQNTLSLPAYISIHSISFGGQSDVRFATSGAPNVSGNLVLRDTIRGRNRLIEIRPSGAVITNTPES
jgi:type II secretory pathway pseudopilin PulG